jgi:hypothetical protein
MNGSASARIRAFCAAGTDDGMGMGTRDGKWIGAADEAAPTLTTA